MTYYQTRSKKQSIKVVSPVLTPISKLRASAKSKLNKLQNLSGERRPQHRSLTPISTDESIFGSHSDISTTPIMESLKLRHPASPGRTWRSPWLAELHSVTDQNGGDRPIGGDRILRTPPP